MKIWKQVKGYEGYYEVSNEGDVKSLDRFLPHSSGIPRLQPGRLLQGEIDYKGYRRFRLSRFGKTKNFLAHKLVAEAFIGDYPKDKVINHIDENPLNNDVGNLEYITQRENINHGTSLKRRAAAQSHKIKGTHIETGEVLTFPSMSAARRESNGFFHDGHISQTIKGKHKHHKGYVWERVID